MSDLPPEGDLSEEIRRLWSKVGSQAPVALEALSLPAAAAGLGTEFAWEAVSLLQRKHGDDARYWAELVEAKERALKDFQERQSLLELEIVELKRRLQNREELSLGESLDIQSKLETAFAALKAERDQHETEQKGLRELLDQTRERMAAESARFRQEQRDWDRREGERLLQIKELEAEVSRRAGEVGAADGQARKLSDSLKEAKNALEKTLAELLRERQIREQSEKEREQALKKVDEVEKHFQELSKLWEEERSQWRELWDRERSTWETQRLEFAGWEERLRKEREAWHAELEAKEKDNLQYAERLKGALRESAVVLERKFLSQAQRRRRLWAAPALAALAAAAFAAWNYLSTPHLRELSAQPVALSNPTALGFDGTSLWAAQWDGTLKAFDPEDLSKSPSRTVTVAARPPYHPVALAFGGTALWSLDAAQARLLRQSAEEPSQVLDARSTPGPAPTALAFDGEAVWSYDAVNKTLYRHDADGSGARAFALDREAVATAMAWVGRRLWVYDSKGKRLLVFALKDGGLRAQAVVPIEAPVIALAEGSIEGRRRLWVLAAPSGHRTSPSVVTYDY